ncbi:transposable element Tcb1 transposase [Trichonephila clavipes]|nr:transposable element Tcb1 transposase [Trichonephila clavipes]
MAVNDRTASFRQLATRWSTATDILMSASSIRRRLLHRGLRGAFIQDPPHGKPSTAAWTPVPFRIMDEPICYELRVISKATGTSVKCYSPKSFPSFKASLGLSFSYLLDSVQPYTCNFFARTVAEEEIGPTGSLTFSELSSLKTKNDIFKVNSHLKKIELHHLGRTPPSHPWYFGRNPGDSFKLIPRKYQTAFSRVV